MCKWFVWKLLLKNAVGSRNRHAWQIKFSWKRLADIQ